MGRYLELLLAFYLIFLKGVVVAHDKGCPGYDLEAAKRCHSVLIQATNETPTNQNDATTRLLCRAWRETQDCLLGLAATCDDRPQVAARYKQEIHDLDMYKDTCTDDGGSNDEVHTSLCYVPYVAKAEECTTHFDVDYFEHVKQNDYAHACNAIEALLSCVDNVVEQVRVACPPSTEQLIRMEEIMPFMEETSQFMNSNCDLPVQQRKLYDELLVPQHPGAAHGGAGEGGRASCVICLLPFMLLWFYCNYLH